MGQAFRYARERLGKSADRQKVYDRLTKDRNFQVGATKMGGTPEEPEEVLREGGLPPVGEDSPLVQDVGEEPLKTGEGWDAESPPGLGWRRIFGS